MTEDLFSPTPSINDPNSGKLIVDGQYNFAKGIEITMGHPVATKPVTTSVTTSSVATTNCPTTDHPSSLTISQLKSVVNYGRKE